jgi:hypothetical protein
MKKNTDMIVMTNKIGETWISRESFVEMGRKGGRAGTGASKRRATTWTRDQAREAAKRPRKRRKAVLNGVPDEQLGAK